MSLELNQLDPRPPKGGYVAAVRGLLAEARGLRLPLGGMAEVETPSGFAPAEVIGFRDDLVQLVPLARMQGISAGPSTEGLPCPRASRCRSTAIPLRRSIGSPSRNRSTSACVP
jgi:flagellar biosynthesis/type III secretory pathway ATPase